MAYPNPILAYAKLNGDLTLRDRLSPNLSTMTGGGALRWQPAEGAVVNLVSNPVFGVNALSAGSGWSRTFEAHPAFVGLADNTAKVTSSGTAGSYIYLNAPFVPVDYGVQYTISAYVYHETGANRNVCLNPQRIALDGTLTSNNYSGDLVVPSHTLTRISYTFTQSDALRRYVRCMIISNVVGTTFQSGESFWVSAFMVNAGTLKPFVAGSLSGCSWIDPVTGQLGAAHASPSCNQVTAWIEEGTTNTLVNPSFENATSPLGWGQYNSTFSKDTTTAYLGSASGKAVCDGTVGEQGIGWDYVTYSIAAATGQTWTFSAYMRGSGTVRLNIVERTSAGGGVLDNYSTPFTLTNNWVRYTLTVTLSGGATTAKIAPVIRTNSAQAVTFYVDCTQLEQKAYATSYCLDPNTYVSTPNGYKRLGEVQVGDDLVGQNGLNSCLAAWPVETEAYEVTLDHGVKLIASAEHRFMATKWPYEKAGASGWSWRELGDLKPGDFMKLSNQVVAPEGSDESDLAYLMGYLVGDGYICSTNSRGQAQAGWTFGERETQVAQEVQDAFERCMTPSKYQKQTPRYHKSGRELFLTTCDRDSVQKFIDRNFPTDCGATHKRLPSSVWNYKQGDLLDFLAGLVDSDGCVNTYNNVVVTMSSKDVVQELQRVISMRLGVHGTYSEFEQKSGYSDDMRTMYRLSFNVADVVRLCDLGFRLRNTRKQDRLNNLLARRDTLVNRPRAWAKIKSIEPLGVRQLIDITLDPDHDFVAEGVVTHNCDGSLGVGYSWSGTAHASSSSRAAGAINFSNVGRATPKQGAIMAKFAGQPPAKVRSIIQLGGFGVGDFVNHLQNVSNTIDIYTKQGSNPTRYIGTAGIVGPAFQTTYGSWSSSLVSVKKLDGNLASVARVDTVSSDVLGTSVTAVGSDGTNYMNGSIGPVAIFSRELTSTERSAYNARIDAYQDLWTLYEQVPFGLSVVSPSAPFSLIRTSSELLGGQAA